VRYLRGGIFSIQFQNSEPQLKVQHSSRTVRRFERDEQRSALGGFHCPPGIPFTTHTSGTGQYVMHDNPNQRKGNCRDHRFIEIRKFRISAYIQNGTVDMVYVPTADMTSDYFTKPLQGALFTNIFAKIMGQK
jgi:hypothetical protein